MDTLTPEERSERMSRVRSRNTKPELLVRQIAHRAGFRFRVHATDWPGKPDLVFRRRRKAIFVHGCFWHRHSDPSCPLAREPKSRQEFWLPKFAANVTRDARVQAELSDRGWRTLVVWECQLRNREQLEGRIREFLDDEVS